MTCGKLIVCWDNSRLPCMRSAGHDNGCNPFSNSKPIVYQFGNGVVWSQHITGTSTTNTTNTSYKYTWGFEPPLNVQCPVCKSLAGVICHTVKYPARWKKGKRKHRVWWEYPEINHSVGNTHKERIRESKIQEVITRLDNR